MRNKFPKPKPFNHILQVSNMAAKFPNFKAERKEYGYDFIGILKPRETQYLIKIMYRKHSDPKVFVLSPELISYKHRYKDGALCIYKQSEFLWRDDKLISTHIVSLSAMWLHYYELFLIYRIWLGPEASHDDTEVKQFIDIQKK